MFDWLPCFLGCYLCFLEMFSSVTMEYCDRSILEMMPFVEIGFGMVCFFLRRPDMSGGKYRRSNSATFFSRNSADLQEYCDILYIA